MEEVKKDEQKKMVQKEIMSLSTAIISAGVIVAAAVLIAANMIAGGSNNRAALTGTGNVQNTGAAIAVEIASRSDAPTQGDGKVVIHEFSDFQCPYCKQFWSTTYPQLKKDYIDTDKITFVYRQFPIASIHPFAQKASEASECANDQGKFFEYHDMLFENGQSNGTGLAIEDLKQYAVDLGLNTSEFNSCLDSGEKNDVVANDMQAGQKAGVSGTPTFFINGKKYVGALPYAQFKQIIDSEL